MLKIKCPQQHYSGEIDLLLLVSRVNPEVFTLERAQAIIDSCLNWDLFVSLSLKHATAALIFKNLVKLNNIPQIITEKFRNIYNNSLRSNVIMVSELDKLVDGLNKDGIEVAALKGSTAAEKMFGDIALYPSSDIDILVKVEDIDGVRKFLEAEGYKLNDKGFDEFRDFFITELYHISLSNDRCTIEPHWNLFFRYFETPSEFWWEESITVSSGGRQYKFLSPEKNVLYTSFRLFSKGFTNFRFLVLIAEIIKYYKNELDWNKLFRYATEYKFENVLRLTMKMSHELLGAPVPEEYSKINRLRTTVLYCYALRMIFGEEEVHPFTKLAFSFLRDDWMGPFKLFLQRIFPSMGEIVSRYKLPPGSGRAVLYYMLNPLMLFLRKHQR
jgi:hypothetical protein